MLTRRHRDPVPAHTPEAEQEQAPKRTRSRKPKAAPEATPEVTEDENTED